MRAKAKFFIFIVAAVFVTGLIAPVVHAQEVIKITAKQFEFIPSEITLKKGVPVVLEFTSADRLHGFDCPGLNIRTDIESGVVNTIKFTPDKVGSFPFHCDNFCGSGHGKMKGTIIVKE